MHVELILLVLSVLFFISIVADRIGYKFGVPALLLFLTVGMIFGSGGLGAIVGEGEPIDIQNAQAIGSVAMCIILFSGGLDTKLSDIKSVLAPGITLATIGVLITALITGTIIYFIFGWTHAVAFVTLPMALLMAATMSSTDSASVFSIMRTHHIGLKHNLRPLLELESGANDPMAYVLTSTLIGVVLTLSSGQSDEVSALPIIQEIVVQLIMGTVLGFLLGKGLIQIMRRVQLGNEALYPIMVLTACIFIFSITYYLKGNTYLAVYVGGLIIGNSKFTRRRQTKAFFNGITWLSQLVMFLMLGLMVKPLDFLKLEVWLPCLIISIVMIFIARPAAVWLCMLPFRNYMARDRMMLSWVGLKGAVPIIFAIMCKANGVPNADLIFNVVFLCTIVSLLTQGTTLTNMARYLKLDTPPEQEHRLTYFDLDLPDEIQSTAREVVVSETMLAKGSTPRELDIPPHTLIVMVRRGEDFFVPTGASELQVGDQLLVISDKDANEAYRQLTNEAEEEAQWREEMQANIRKRFERATQWMAAQREKVKKMNNK